jgi:predicted ATP-grasp superfamily ATP-dependent carboligase
LGKPLGAALDDKMLGMKKLRILVFEYITGGGLNKTDLLESLVREGLLMLQALLDDLARIDKVVVVVMLDSRLSKRLPTSTVEMHLIGAEQDCQQEFVRLMHSCEAVWPIAPETDAILQTLCNKVMQQDKILLNSPAEIVAITGNKWLTYQELQRNSIATVQTYLLDKFNFYPGEWLIKVMDGVSCSDSYLVNDEKDFAKVSASLDKPKFIIQPHIQGEKTSLSCLFKQGRVWLLTVNHQQFELINKQYHLTGITVNFTSEISKYQGIINNVVKAVPDLWGYTGIDLIETENEILVLEINPRLTSSYAGIYAALGINVADAVLSLLTGEPSLQPSRNLAIDIKFTGQVNNAD